MRLMRGFFFGLFGLAWLFYLLLGPNYTISILIVHYTALFCLSLDLLLLPKKKKAIIWLFIYLLSLCLDLFLYDSRFPVGLDTTLLTFAYYASINILHISIILVFEKSIELEKYAIIVYGSIWGFFLIVWLIPLGLPYLFSLALIQLALWAYYLRN